MSKNNLASLPPFAQVRSIANSRWYMGNMMTFLDVGHPPNARTSDETA
jgi:hypothetical protein